MSNMLDRRMYGCDWTGALAKCSTDWGLLALRKALRRAVAALDRVVMLACAIAVMHDANVIACARVLARPSLPIWGEHASGRIMVLEYHGLGPAGVHEILHKAVVCIAALVAESTFRETSGYIQHTQLQRWQCVHVHIPQLLDLRASLFASMAALCRAHEEVLLERFGRRHLQMPLKH